MKYYSIRVIQAESIEQATIKVEENEFDENDALCDKIIPESEVSFLVKIDARVQKAYAYLCDTDEDSVADQICLIENYLSAGAAAGTGWDLCSHVDGVCVWEPLESTLTIRQFLEAIWVSPNA